MEFGSDMERLYRMILDGCPEEACPLPDNTWHCADHIMHLQICVSAWKRKYVKVLHHMMLRTSEEIDALCQLLLQDISPILYPVESVSEECVNDIARDLLDIWWSSLHDYLKLVMILHVKGSRESFCNGLRTVRCGPRFENPNGPFFVAGFIAGSYLSPTEIKSLITEYNLPISQDQLPSARETELEYDIMFLSSREELLRKLRTNKQFSAYDLSMYHPELCSEIGVELFPHAMMHLNPHGIRIM